MPTATVLEAIVGPGFMRWSYDVFVSYHTVLPHGIEHTAAVFIPAWIWRLIDVSQLEHEGCKIQAVPILIFTSNSVGSLTSALYLKESAKEPSARQMASFPIFDVLVKS